MVYYSALCGRAFCVIQTDKHTNTTMGKYLLMCSQFRIWCHHLSTSNSMLLSAQ